MFMFGERELVKLKRDNPELRLKAGAVGKVWAFYDLEEPAYEVEFCDEDGRAFSMVIYESEIEKLLKDEPN